MTLLARESFSPTRRTYAEDDLSGRFRDAPSARRPVDPINRVRSGVSPELHASIREEDARSEKTPTSLTPVPDRRLRRPFPSVLLHPTFLEATT